MVYVAYPTDDDFVQLLTELQDKKLEKVVKWVLT